MPERCAHYSFKVSEEKTFAALQALLKNGKMCLAGCGRTGISLSELKPSVEARNLLRAVNLSTTNLANVVIVEEESFDSVN